MSVPHSSLGFTSFPVSDTRCAQHPQGAIQAALKLFPVKVQTNLSFLCTQVDLVGGEGSEDRIQSDTITTATKHLERKDDMIWQQETHNGKFSTPTYRPPGTCPPPNNLIYVVDIQSWGREKDRDHPTKHLIKLDQSMLSVQCT